MTWLWLGLSLPAVSLHTSYRINHPMGGQGRLHKCFLLDNVLDMRFLLLHDGQSRGNDTIRSFFTDMYDTFVKVISNYNDSTSTVCIGSYSCAGWIEPVLRTQHTHHVQSLQKKGSTDCQEVSLVLYHYVYTSLIIFKSLMITDCVWTWLQQ